MLVSCFWDILLKKSCIPIGKRSCKSAIQLNGVSKAERVGDFIALGDGTMVQTDVEGYLDGDYPVFMGRSKLVSREQFRVPAGRDSVSSPGLSSASTFADAGVCATAAVQGNSGTVLTSGQEAGLSEENDPQPTAIGPCGYAHFSPPKTAEETARRIERAGSTPPPTPTQDLDVISDEVTEHTAHEESSVLYEHDASYPLTIAQGQPPMERHLVPLSATPTAVPSPALPTLFPTPFPL